MKLSRSLYLYTGIIVLSMIIIGSTLFYFYDKMGGFDELEVVNLGPVERTVAGLSYQGKAQTKAYEEIVSRCADQILNNKLDGVLTIIDYASDTLDKNEVNLFIGVTLNSSMSELPYDFEIREFSSKERYAVNLSMHPMVRPSIDHVQALLAAQANQADRELLSMYVELYYIDDSMTVEAWAR